MLITHTRHAHPNHVLSSTVITTRHPAFTVVDAKGTRSTCYAVQLGRGEWMVYQLINGAPPAAMVCRETRAAAIAAAKAYFAEKALAYPAALALL